MMPSRFSFASNSACEPVPLVRCRTRTNGHQVNAARAAIGATHRDHGADDPTAHAGVRKVLRGIARQSVGRGRGQAAPLTADGLAAIIATADRPRRRGRGWETEQVATDRGATDKALAGLLFQGGLRRSEAAALTWGDVQRATDGAGVRVRVRTSKTNQTGDRADVALPQERRRRGTAAHRPESCASDTAITCSMSDSRRLSNCVKS